MIGAVYNSAAGAFLPVFSGGGPGAVDPATFTVPPYRVLHTPDAAPSAATYRATPANVAAHF